MMLAIFRYLCMINFPLVIICLKKSDVVFNVNLTFNAHDKTI